MKLLTCPFNGPRPLQEFVYGGVVRPMPDPKAVTDAQWADYVFNRTGEPGTHQEWWYHIPSGTWFIAERDNVQDVVIRTYLYGGSSASGGDPSAEPDAAGAQSAGSANVPE